MARLLLVGGLASSLVRFRGPLIDAALAAGHEVICVAGEPDDATIAELRRRGVAFHAIELERTGTNFLCDVRAILSLTRLMRRVRPDVVLGYTVKPALYTCFASYLTGIGSRYAMLTGLGYALTPQDGPSTGSARIARWMARRVLPTADKVFFHNGDDSRHCEATGLIRATQSIVVPGSGVDLASYPPAPMPPGPTIFLLVARLLREKGIEEFVRAACEVHRRFPAARFRVVGDRDATARSVTAAEIESWSRHTPVEFVGPVQQPWSELAASHVFVLPSTNREGLPRTLLEAMAVGRAVITTDLPGCRDAVIADNGIVVAPGNVPALADAMARFIEQPSLAAEMGARGRALAVSRFDARIVATAMLDGMGLRDSRPRVLHIITGLATGGAESSLLRVITATHREVAHCVVSLTTKGTRGTALEALGVPVYALGLTRGALAPSAIGALRRLVREHRPGCVQGWMYHGNLAASALALSGARTGPVFWNVRHALDAWQTESRTRRTLIRLSAWLSTQPHTVVYNSERAAKQHIALGFRSGNRRVIANGVDTTRFTPDHVAGARVRAALGIPLSAFVVGMIARVDPLKDHDTFLAAIATDADRNDRTWYVLAGSDTGPGSANRHGALDARVAALVRDHPALGDRIVRLGERHDVGDLINACDVVTLTSRSEGSPNAIAEAMACGVPCVVTDVGDAAVLVGDSGIVVPVGQHGGIADAWQHLRDDDVSRRARGQRAVAAIRSSYTAEIEAAAYRDQWAPNSRPKDGTPAAATPRVLFVTTASVTLRAFLLPYTDYFRARGWRVDGLAAGAASDPTLSSHFDRTFDISWARSPLRLQNFRAVRRIRALVRAEQYDLVHVHTPVAAFVTRFALRHLSTPVVVYTAHSFHADRSAAAWKNLVFRMLERIAGRWTDHLVVLNQSDHELARRDGLVPDHRLHWHAGIGVDTQQLLPATHRHRAETRAALGVGESDPLMVMVAEFTSNKRQRDLIAAVSTLKKRGAVMPTVLMIGDGLTRPELEAQVERAGVTEHIRFLGFRTDVAALVSACNALVLCSAREGLPRCVLEAQAMEVPVIGTAAKGTADLLAEGRGLTVPVGDVEALANAILEVLRQPTEARRRAERGGAWVRDNCDLSTMLARHHDLYADALGLPRASTPDGVAERPATVMTAA